jgi:Fe-S-cluster containining protein
MNRSELPPETDTANIHLSLLGEERTFSVPIRLGKRTPLELLPAARELTMQATAVAVAQAQARAKQISCRVGCGACCRQLVAISVVEAQALADVVAAMPAERQQVIRARFAEALRRLEEALMLDPKGPKGRRALMVMGQGDASKLRDEVGQRYFRLQIACPFLEDESCSIHAERPLVCREYHVTSPAEKCAKLYEVRVDKVEPPLHMSGVLARAADRIAGTGARTIPLVLALEWVEARGAKLRQEYDGLEMFKTLLSEMDKEHEKPFEERADSSLDVGPTH